MGQCNESKELYNTVYAGPSQGFSAAVTQFALTPAGRRRDRDNGIRLLPDKSFRRRHGRPAVASMTNNKETEIIKEITPRNPAFCTKRPSRECRSHRAKSRCNAEDDLASAIYSFRDIHFKATVPHGARTEIQLYGTLFSAESPDHATVGTTTKTDNGPPLSESRTSKPDIAGSSWTVGPP